MKKYELTSSCIEVGGTKLFQIRALMDFSDVRAGDMGGYIESEDNLAHTGNSWVFENARVTGNACVSENARVAGNAWVSENAWVSGDARVAGNAWVIGDACVFGNTSVTGNACVLGTDSIFWVSGVGSRHDTTTFFLCQDRKIRVSCGCFFGDLEAFAAKVQETHGDNRHGNVYRLAIEMAKQHILIPDSSTLDKR